VGLNLSRPDLVNAATILMKPQSVRKRLMRNMEVEQEQQRHPLKNGQTWKVEHGYLHIVEMGKRLVHYKFLRQLQNHGTTTRLIGVVELLIFLKHNEAELVN
jgi:hypothetical protein